MIDCKQIKQSFFVFFLSLWFFFPSELQAQIIQPHNKFVKKTGDVLLVTLPATAALTTLILDDKKGTWEFTKGFVANLIITTGLKYAINKRRPFHGGYQAFPSGHTSITFQAASFVHRRYGFKYSIPTYALAGFTAYSRINATRHDGYDILAGAVVGIGSSFLFTTPYQQEHMQLSFSRNDEEYMLGFIYRF